jgi:hypothetical protein
MVDVHDFLLSAVNAKSIREKDLSSELAFQLASAHVLSMLWH